MVIMIAVIVYIVEVLYGCIVRAVALRTLETISNQSLSRGSAPNSLHASLFLVTGIISGN